MFQGGSEIAEVQIDEIKDLNIRINNKMIQTGNDFVKIGRLLGENKAKELKDKLSLIFDNYLITEFAKMGYSLKNKQVD